MYDTPELRNDLTTQVLVVDIETGESVTMSIETIILSSLQLEYVNMENYATHKD